MRRGRGSAPMPRASSLRKFTSGRVTAMRLSRSTTARIACRLRSRTTASRTSRLAAPPYVSTTPTPTWAVQCSEKTVQRSGLSRCRRSTRASRESSSLTGLPMSATPALDRGSSHVLTPTTKWPRFMRTTTRASASTRRSTPGPWHCVRRKRCSRSQAATR